MFLPKYRAWVILASVIVCLSTWFVIERTRLGSYLRAATENPQLVQAFGINVPRMITLTYGFGVALAAFAGVMAAPIYQVSPQMGENLIIVVFAVVVIGGMGSILGAILTGFGWDRGRADQGVLSGSVEHRGLRDHGHRARHQAGRPVRQGKIGRRWRSWPLPPRCPARGSAISHGHPGGGAGAGAASSASIRYS